LQRNDLKQNADSLLRTAIEAGDVPGVVAMAIDREGLIYEGAFGNASSAGAGDDAGYGRLDRFDDEGITSAGAMRLVEQGKLDLDSPANRWVPELASVQVLEASTPRGAAHAGANAADHAAPFADAYRRIRLPCLERGHRPLLPGQSLPALQLRERGPARAAAVRSRERWNYGINIEWAGKIVEAVSGKRLGAYLNECLLAPLGMNDTAFKITPSMRERLAKAHQRGDDGVLSAIDFEIRRNPSSRWRAVALLDSRRLLEVRTHDLNRGKGNGARVLAPETVDLMSRTTWVICASRCSRPSCPPGPTTRNSFRPSQELGLAS